MKKKQLSVFLCIASLIVSLAIVLSSCSKKIPEESIPSTSEFVIGQFSLDGLPPYANELLNLWRKTDEEVFDLMGQNQGWDNNEPSEGSMGAIYFVNGSAPPDAQGVISDGTLEYCGRKWGLNLGFGPAEGADPNHEKVWGLGRVQYETVVETAEEAKELMDTVILQLQSSIGEPMDIGNNTNYFTIEDKDEAVKTLPKNRGLYTVWDITPEGENVYTPAEGASVNFHFRVMVLLNVYGTERGNEQDGYAVKIRFYTTQFENWM